MADCIVKKESNKMILKYKVNKNYESINQLIKTEFNLSSRLLVKLIKNKKILLNGSPCDTRTKPKLNDSIEVLLDLEEDNSNIEATQMHLNIIYEDEGMLVINKPAGISVHPSIRHYNDSLSNGIKYYFDKIGLKKKIRPVNRLDLDTSGLVIFTKNEYIQEGLIKQMKDNSFKKEYICVVKGKFDDKTGVIDLPIARKENSIIERCVCKNGQKAITRYEVIKEKEDYSIVRCFLETGRTHQIRVHMSHIGHSILGDTLYGSSSALISRQALHCKSMTFINPVNNQTLKITCPIPEDINRLIIQ